MLVPPLARPTPLTLDDIRELLRLGDAAVTEALIAMSVHIAGLEQRLGKHSGNSGKPPSSDGLQRQRRRYIKRERSGRKPGGQVGHPGHTLPRRENPDTIIPHAVKPLCDCGNSLTDVPAEYETRQIIDLPPPIVKVTEHQAERKKCPRCGRIHRATFPAGVPPGVSYGQRVRTTALYLQHQQLVPARRTTNLMADLYGIQLSEGALALFQRRCAELVRPAENVTRALLCQAEQKHADETGAHCNGVLHWLHTLSHVALTLYGFDHSRGRDAMERMGVLPNCTGKVMHDHMRAYGTFTDSFVHVLCNAHHVRELRFIAEVCAEPWAALMAALLNRAYGAVRRVTARGLAAFSLRQRQRYHAEYRLVLAKGVRFHRQLGPPASTGKRGRKTQHPGKNLLDRLVNGEKETLAFVDDFTVPFTNNLAERDLRMTKVKMKISGGFRTQLGAENFFRIRGYLSTAQKQHWNMFDALSAAVRGEPFIPKLSP